MQCRPGVWTSELRTGKFGRIRTGVGESGLKVDDNPGRYVFIDDLILLFEESVTGQGHFRPT